VAKVTAKLKLLRRVLKKWAKGLSQIKKQIQESSLVIAVMDRREENRPLFLQERNFRQIIRNHIQNLLKCQKEYWRKRYMVRWTKLGDENTSFFHAAATKRYRINTITSLDTKDGRPIFEQDEKAALIWDEYRKRMGCTTHPEMKFNLNDIVHLQDLQSIAGPFSKEDIDQVVKTMPYDKAPGPDGFNGIFIKKCWHIIRDDIYELCMDFFNGVVDLQAINNSYITLVPKVNTPMSINEFRGYLSHQLHC
jgi:hypothetical protein